MCSLLPKSLGRQGLSSLQEPRVSRRRDPCALRVLWATVGVSVLLWLRGEFRSPRGGGCAGRSRESCGTSLRGKTGTGHLCRASRFSTSLLTSPTCPGDHCLSPPTWKTAVAPPPFCLVSPQREYHKMETWPCPSLAYPLHPEPLRSPVPTSAADLTPPGLCSCWAHSLGYPPPLLHLAPPTFRALLCCHLSPCPFLLPSPSVAELMVPCPGSHSTLSTCYAELS